MYRPIPVRRAQPAAPRTPRGIDHFGRAFTRNAASRPAVRLLNHHRVCTPPRVWRLRCWIWHSFGRPPFTNAYAFRSRGRVRVAAWPLPTSASPCSDRVLTSLAPPQPPASNNSVRTNAFASVTARAHSRRQVPPTTSAVTKMGPSDPSPSDADMVTLKPKEIGDADFANYFCTYGYLYHQKDMLEDQARMTAYHNAVRMNPGCFKDKVVLDVGTGSGILAIWAAQNGAKKVYAVEATYMAHHARKLIKANGLDHIIEVLQSTVEEVELPEKVDVIISEWMGYFLLRESMFDSVIVARDKFLKPGGSLFPSHAKMYLAPIRTGTAEKKHLDYEDSCAGWDDFSEQVRFWPFPNPASLFYL